MTTFSRLNPTGDNTTATDAAFRTWGQGFHDVLVAMGLIQTSDTGQINLTTVTKPSVINTVAGYEIWRFNDSLQSTKPIFIKVEYTSGQFSANLPGFFITFGTGSDGSGNLTGQVSERRRVAQDNSGAINWYVSVGAGRFMWVALGSSTSGFAMICVERTKDISGTDTADGFFAVTTDGQNVNGFDMFFQIIPFSGPIPAYASTCPTYHPANGFSTKFPKVALGPMVGALGKIFYGWLLVYNYESTTGGDFGALNPFTIRHLGSDHTYLPLGIGGSKFFSQSAPINRSTSAILWE